MGIVTARRKEDMAVAIVQNNVTKTITIEEVNRTLASTLLYEESELIGMNFFSIIDANTKDKIHNYIEFENYGIDIQSILLKTKSINFIKKDGTNIKVKMKIFPITSKNNQEIRFEILAKEPNCFDKLAEFREESGDFEHTIDLRFKVMDKFATAKEVELLSTFCQKHNENCVIGIIELKYFSYNFAQGIIKTLKANTRSYDEIGLLGDNLIILLLIGCNGNQASQVTTRLYTKLKKVVQDVRFSYVNLYGYKIEKLDSKVLLSLRQESQLVS